jgi:predicted glycosyltransferase
VSEQETGADVTVVSYPNSRYFNAFDLLVLAAGYNSVAEAFTFQAPAIFFPNTSTGSDDQVSRALSLTALGNWQVMLEWNESEFVRQVHEVLETGREGIEHQYQDGAGKAAELIRELVD